MQSSIIRSSPAQWLILACLLAQFSQAADVLTARNDNARTGQNLAETILTPQNVNSSAFGRLFSFATDGYVYAQPLYKSQVNIPGQGVHNVLYVATEHDSVYAFDADGKNPANGYLWRESFINPSSGITTVSPRDVGTGDIVPEIGITGTPVIDPATNILYVVAKTKEVASGKTTFVQRLHALDLGTGAERAGAPVQIAATVSGVGAGSLNGVLPFDPRVEHQRGALMLLNGVVYIPWGAHGDQGNYHGWVIGYQASNVQQQVAVYTNTPDGWGGGLWMSGGGVSADSAANLYAVAGNGDFDTRRNFADSAIRLSTQSGLIYVDSFTPNNQDMLTRNDLDMGVSDALILPDQPGPFPHLLITADKTGAVYLIDRESMGGYNPTSNANVQTLSIGTTIHNNIGYFGNAVYIGSDGNSLQAFPLANGQIAGVPSSKSPNKFGVNSANASGTSPIFSAAGAANAIVWALDNFGNGSAPAVLYAYDANNLGTILYSSDQAPGGRDVAGKAVKFTTPTVTDGRVFVPGANSITVYGLLSGGITSDTAAPAFNPATGTIFNSPQIVTLSDSTPGAVIYYTTDGSVPSTSSAIYSAPVQISGPTTINAFASAAGFNASQVVSAFYTVQSGSTPLSPQFGSGFTATGLALNGGAKLNATRLQLTDGGMYEARSAFYTTPVNVERFTTEFSFQLSQAVSDGFTFTIQGAGPDALGSPASGLGFGPDPSYHVSAFERSINSSVAVKFDLFDNAGEGSSSVGLFTNGVTPTVPAANVLPFGIDLHNGHIYHARMVYDGAVLALTLYDTTNPALVYSTNFTVDIPGTVGGSTAYVGFTAATGGTSSIQEILQWNFSPVPNYQAGFSTAGMTLNGGTVVLPDNRLRLTDGGATQARTAYFGTPVSITNFAADFTFQLTGAVADGFAFVVQNAGPEAIGVAGGGLGFAGIAKSVALKFDLYNNAGEGNNSIGVFTGGANPFTPSVDLTPTGIDLHSGDTFSAHVTYDGVVLGIILRDLTRPGIAYVGSFAINLPVAVGGNYAYVGFTAGTGGLTAVQDILTFTLSNPGQNVTYPLATVPAFSSGPAVLPYYWPYLKYGFGSYMVATAVGDWVEYAVTLPWTGRYHVYIGSKPAYNRAIWQLSVDNADLGAPHDDYVAGEQVAEIDAGDIFQIAGTHGFRFRVVGKNPSSSNLFLAFDYIRLVPE